MTKKDYVLIAGCFSDIAKAAMTHREKQLVCRLATMLNNRLAAERHEFDPQIFLTACKLPKVEGFNC